MPLALPSFGRLCTRTFKIALEPDCRTSASTDPDWDILRQDDRFQQIVAVAFAQPMAVQVPVIVQQSHLTARSLILYLSLPVLCPSSQQSAGSSGQQNQLGSYRRKSIKPN